LSSQVINSYLYAESCEDVDQEQLLHNDQTSLGHNSSTYESGMKFATASALGVGAKLVSYTMFLAKGSLGVGNTNLVTSRLYTSAGVLKETSNTFDPQTLPTHPTYQEVLLDFSGTVTIADGDYVTFYFNSGGGDYLHAHYQNTDVYDSTNTIMFRNSGTFVGEDNTFKITYCE